MKDTPLQQILLKLKSVFPEAVTETRKQDDDGRPWYAYALKQEFIRQLEAADLDMVNDRNRYELQFPGKQIAKAAAFAPCYKTLVADREQSKDFDATGNVFIEGDNLDALKMLQTSYRGRVKMIYIDPPYNTGGDDFVYNDDFSIKQKEYLQKAGVLDEDGIRQVDEISTGLRGRFHAGWLAFMYPRLKLARELLSDDGVIFISIDDNEQANLKLICDEIYGESNFVASIIWRKKSGGGQDSEYLAREHEYVLCYRKGAGFKINFRTTEVTEKDFPKTKNGNRCRFLKLEKWGSNAYREDRPTMFYPIKDPDGNDFYPKAPNGRDGNWRTRPTALDDEHIHWEKRNGGWVPYEVIYFHETNGKEKTIKERTIFYDLATTTHATNEQKDLFNEKVFDNPKPVELILRLIQLAGGEDSIVLDFFAGSATTAHAVMQLNAEDGGERKFIMVQLPETIDPKKSREAADFCANELKRPATIAEIAKERIRRAGVKIAEETSGAPHAKDMDTGFRAFVIQDSLLIADEEQPLARTAQAELKRYITELKRENFEPLLYEALLKTGVTLDLPLTMDEIDGYPVAICDRRCYCVTENLTQKIVREITEKHSEVFDILYYLSDAPDPAISFTEIEAVIHQAPGNKQIQELIFY